MLTLWYHPLSYDVSKTLRIMQRKPLCPLSPTWKQCSIRHQTSQRPEALDLWPDKWWALSSSTVCETLKDSKDSKAATDLQCPWDSSCPEWDNCYLNCLFGRKSSTSAPWGAHFHQHRHIHRSKVRLHTIEVRRPGSRHFFSCLVSMLNSAEFFSVLV